MTPYFETTSGISSSATRRYVVGPSVEVALPLSLGIELDALYRRIGYHAHTVAGRIDQGDITTTDVDVKGNSWDFPLLLNYHTDAMHLFVAGGGTLRYISSAHATGTTSVLSVGGSTSSAIATDSPTELRKRVYPGLTLGGGLEFGSGRLRLQPELRYTHWLSNVGATYLHFGPNQVDLMVGLYF